MGEGREGREGEIGRVGRMGSCPRWINGPYFVHGAVGAGGLFFLSPFRGGGGMLPTGVTVRALDYRSLGARI